MNIKSWVADLNVTSFASVNNQFVYTIVVVGFSTVASILMLRGNTWGLELAQFILGTAIAKSVVTAASRAGKQLTDVDYVAAKGQAKAAANEGKVNVQNVEQVTVTDTKGPSA